MMTLSQFDHSVCLIASNYVNVFSVQSSHLGRIGERKRVMCNIIIEDMSIPKDVYLLLEYTSLPSLIFSKM